MTYPRPTHPLFIGYYMADIPLYGQAFNDIPCQSWNGKASIADVDSYYRGEPIVPEAVITSTGSVKIVGRKVVNNGKVLPIAQNSVDFYPECSPFTNLYHADSRYGYATPTMRPSGRLANLLWEGLWISRMFAGLRRAANEGKRICWNMELPKLGLTGGAEKMLWYFEVDWRNHQPGNRIWDFVSWIDLVDEPDWDTKTVNGRLATIKRKLKAHGLPLRPFGITPAASSFEKPAAPGLHSLLPSNLDFINVEVYLDPLPGQSDDSLVPVWRDKLEARIRKVMALCRKAGKRMLFTPQGYDRNGGWTNRKAMAEFQKRAYLMAHDAKDVEALTIFNWARGTTDVWGSRPLPPRLPLDPNHPQWRPEMMTEHMDQYLAITG